MVPAAAKGNHRVEGLLSRVADSIAVEIMADLATRLERHQRKRSSVPSTTEQMETAKPENGAGPEGEAPSAIEDSDERPLG
jgi:hypothetical protein